MRLASPGMLVLTIWVLSGCSPGSTTEGPARKTEENGHIVVSAAGSLIDALERIAGVYEVA